VFRQAQQPFVMC